MPALGLLPQLTNILKPVVGCLSHLLHIEDSEYQVTYVILKLVKVYHHNVIKIKRISDPMKRTMRCRTRLPAWLSGLVWADILCGVMATISQDVSDLHLPSNASLGM